MKKEANILAFWIKVTPGMLALMGTKSLGNSLEINTIIVAHLLTVLESLQQFHSESFLVLFNLWAGFFNSFLFFRFGFRCRTLTLNLSIDRILR